MNFNKKLGSRLKNYIHLCLTSTMFSWILRRSTHLFFKNYLQVCLSFKKIWQCENRKSKLPYNKEN